MYCFCYNCLLLLDKLTDHSWICLLTVSVCSVGSIIPETVKCVEGTFASLPSGVVEVRSGDQMLWTFENEKSPIATMSKNDKKTYFYDDKRFRGRLQLDHQTGSLIIRNLRKTDSGVYLLQIKSTGGTTYRKYKVILNGESI